MVDRKKFGLAGWALAIVGTIADHLSTNVALTLPHLYETNPFTQILILLQLWWVFDLAMLMIAMVVPFILSEQYRVGWVTYAYPIVYGTLRLGAGVHNLRLILLQVVFG